MSAPTKTLAQYLQWAAEEPRTSRWSALVAYDRGKCNQLLLQEYIEKHDKNSIMPPINEPYGETDKNWNWLIDYVTDAPRLSFNNNPDPNSAEVNMSMAIVGGKDIRMDDTNGFAQVNRISSYDPLDHPRLEADRVLLKDIQGSVNEDGEVVLDLGDPLAQRYIWEVKGDRVQHQRRMAGAFLKRKFREADKERRTFSLGTLAHTTQAFMRPQSFRLRTIMEDGAATRGAANFGNGAVEMRIAMDDELPGGLPGNEWIYPLPSDRPDLNALTLFGTRFFMHSIIGKGSARAFKAPNAEFDGETNGKGFVYKIKVKPHTEGFLEIPPIEATVGGRTMRIFDYKLPIYIAQDYLLTMTLYYDGAGLPYFEVGMGEGTWRRPTKCLVDGTTKEFNMGVGLSATYQFSIDDTSRRLKVSLRNYQSYTSVGGTQNLPSDVRSYMDSQQFQDKVGDLVANTAMAVFNGLEEIDVFVLHTLFFNDEDAVQLKTLNLTGEMVLFGAINPRLTTFAIDPVEVMVGYDRPHQFRTIPQTTGVKWSVEDLEGNTTGAGSINPDTGAYRAPPLADLHGTYKRVKIIATGPGSGNDRHISKALVTIVARPITLNPLIEVCTASKADRTETRQFTAHTMSGALRWSVNGDGEIPPAADAEGNNTYIAPLVREGYPVFFIDEVVVVNTETNQQQKSLIIVKNDQPAFALKTDFQGMPPNQVTIKATLGGQIPTQPLEWTCIPADAGTITPDPADHSIGLFRHTQTTNSQFVVIIALLDIGIKLDGYTILPLPLAPLPPKPAVEDPQTLILDDLNESLGAVYEKFEKLSSGSDDREKAKEYLNHIASLAEDNRNGQ